MQKLNSISLFIMGVGMLFLAKFMENQWLQIVAVLISIVFSIMAIVRNFKEKRENKL